MIDELLELAVSLATDAGRLTLEMRAEARLRPDVKSSVSDLVTAADRAAEAHIVAGIERHRPADAIVGEEGADRSGTSGVRWVIDPIDGTTNYVYGLPGYTVSVAAEFEGATLAGVVFDPKAGECFAAGRGRGATLDGVALRCSQRSELAESVIGTGFGYAAEMRQRQALILVHLLPRVANIRRLGSAALDLAYVGAGRLDAYYESGLNHWDAAAGVLIAEEAGALITDIDGNAPSIEMTIAGPPVLQSALREELVRAGADHLETT